MNKLKNLFKKDKDADDVSHDEQYSNKSSQQYQQSSNQGSQYQQSSSSNYSQHPTSQSASNQQYADPRTEQRSAAAPQNQQQYSSGAGQGHESSQGRKQGVLLTTNYGDIGIVLFSEHAPKTCKNFAGLADSGKYDGVIFHRIIQDFMIQGGDPTGTGRGGESIFGGKFEDEFHRDLRHTSRGILSMANSGPGTNGSQFFITLGPTPHLDGKHTVFGQVVSGLEVVDAIGNTRTDSQDRPLETIKIVKAESFFV
ncbi:hypothetical protein H2200_004991 [Cladophialophora chaetospira]|uniref:Peptidyl-prolyl cis-trans isomerase n=1 Tax=Cladophialophora chaetospira TaxID=386627 RepID=A0AA39CIK0_9EURO|nr:hypothetical protein H2200_004991 [Cladophialophora chaetospira]